MTAVLFTWIISAVISFVANVDLGYYGIIEFQPKGEWNEAKEMFYKNKRSRAYRLSIISFVLFAIFYGIWIVKDPILNTLSGQILVAFRMLLVLIGVIMVFNFPYSWGKSMQLK